MVALKNRADWDEALARLMARLAALEIGGVEHRTRIAMRLLDRARERDQDQPGLGPVEVTMDVAAEELERWFGLALPGIPAERRVATGIVALQMTEAAERWPDVILMRDPPEEMKSALANVSLRAGPDLAFSSMTPQEMDFGAMETLAQETWHQFAWTPILRAAALWTAVYFAALYAYDRFFPQ